MNSHQTNQLSSIIREYSISFSGDPETREYISKKPSNPPEINRLKLQNIPHENKNISNSANITLNTGSYKNKYQELIKSSPLNDRFRNNETLMGKELGKYPIVVEKNYQKDQISINSQAFSPGKQDKNENLSISSQRAIISMTTSSSSENKIIKNQYNLISPENKDKISLDFLFLSNKNVKTSKLFPNNKTKSNNSPILNIPFSKKKHIESFFSEKPEKIPENLVISQKSIKNTVLSYNNNEKKQKTFTNFNQTDIFLKKSNDSSLLLTPPTQNAKKNSKILSNTEKNKEIPSKTPNKHEELKQKAFEIFKPYSPTEHVIYTTPSRSENILKKTLNSEKPSKKSNFSEPINTLIIEKKPLKNLKSTKDNDNNNDNNSDSSIEIRKIPIIPDQIPRISIKPEAKIDRNLSQSIKAPIKTIFSENIPLITDIDRSQSQTNLSVKNEQKVKKSLKLIEKPCELTKTMNLNEKKVNFTEDPLEKSNSYKDISIDVIKKSPTLSEESQRQELNAKDNEDNPELMDKYLCKTTTNQDSVQNNSQDKLFKNGTLKYRAKSYRKESNVVKMEFLNLNEFISTLGRGIFLIITFYKPKIFYNFYKKKIKHMFFQ